MITGGTGSFGRAFIKNILNQLPDIKRIVIFSRDELKQYHLEKEFPRSKFAGLRFFLGDIRDKDRLTQALNGIDVVIHAAALKQVPAAEYNPFEFVKTNIVGSQNLIEASLVNNVKKFVALSTDKAAAPINLYGATKLCSDKLFVAANNISGGSGTTFSVVRYGNVMGSRGSVIPHFLQTAKEGFIPITSPEMTRFNITLNQGVQMVLWTIQHALGGEIFVPKIPSYRILDLAQAIDSNAKIKIIGIRPGEKIHEEMITASDSTNTIDIGNYYAIVPSMQLGSEKDYLAFFKGKKVKSGFSYNSLNNIDYLSVSEIKMLIDKNVEKHYS